jgi:putative toxin-antitoxin system antitoxin component (TIGR02293 family)
MPPKIKDWAAQNQIIRTTKIVLIKDDFEVEAWVSEDMSRLAEEVFGDKETALNWLHQPNLAIDDRAPIDLLQTPDGCDRVKNLLLRIKYGVLA